MKAEQAGLLLDQFRETKVGRRRECRIAAQDHQEFNLVLLDCLNQVAKRLDMVNRPHFDRLRVQHRLPEIAETLV